MSWDGRLFERVLEAGPYAGMRVWVYRQIYNDRLVLGWPEAVSYERGFCFPQDGSALAAGLEWDGEGDPPGPWIKEVGTERYGPGSKRWTPNQEGSDEEGAEGA